MLQSSGIWSPRADEVARVAMVKLFTHVAAFTGREGATPRQVRVPPPKGLLLYGRTVGETHGYEG